MGIGVAGSGHFANKRRECRARPPILITLRPMKYCDLTLPLPEENLACDEVLFDRCEEGDESEIIRFWEPKSYFVVVGYANKVETEVNLEFCLANAIPVFRRCTGGGTVLQGPGVLNYSLILRQHSCTELQSIAETNEFVLKRNQRALNAVLAAPVERRGQTDLAIGGLKFSGNAQRRHRQCLVFHGSILLDLDLTLVEKVLPMPSRQPDYRLNRSHKDFLMNLKIPAEGIKAALAAAWDAQESLAAVPLDRIHLLAQNKYALEVWNRRI